MIGYLEGEIKKVTGEYVIVLVGGVGYRVYVMYCLLSSIKEGSKIKLFIHNYIKEDSNSLYGFKDFRELETFEVLISISGIGPKLAFNILTTTTIDKLRKAVADTDISVLTRIPGIGKRSAGKIMLELTSKFKLVSNLKKMVFSPDDDLAIQALVKLGYSDEEARRAVKSVGDKNESLEEKITESLRYLSR